MMNAKRNKGLTENGATELSEEDTLKIDGGIALLLPAVQKAREAASRNSSQATAIWPAFKQR